MKTKSSDFRALRIKAGFRSRRRAADFFGVAENTIYRWESGRSSPPQYALTLLRLQSEMQELQTLVKEKDQAYGRALDQLIRQAFRMIREELGISQEELAVRANVSRSWVAHFEHQRLIPTPEAFSLALKALELNPSLLLKKIPRFGRVLSELDPEAARILLLVLIASGLIQPSAPMPTRKRRRPQLPDGQMPLLQELER